LYNQTFIHIFRMYLLIIFYTCIALLRISMVSLYYTWLYFSLFVLFSHVLKFDIICWGFLRYLQGFRIYNAFNMIIWLTWKHLLFCGHCKKWMKITKYWLEVVNRKRTGNTMAINERQNTTNKAKDWATPIRSKNLNWTLRKGKQFLLN
jgi:hypothetical protein